MSALGRGVVTGVDREAGQFAVWFPDPNLIADYPLSAAPDVVVNDRVSLNRFGSPVIVPRTDAGTEQELDAVRENTRQLLLGIGIER